jgi:hypothetical protein
MKTLKDGYQYILGIVIVIAFFWLLIVLVRREIPETNGTLLNVTIGALIGAFTTVVGYFYGSSKGSAEKNELIAKIKDEVKPGNDGTK